MIGRLPTPPPIADTDESSEPFDDEELPLGTLRFISVDPNESGDIHELVRGEFSRIWEQGFIPRLARMTIDQMYQLKEDWDCRNCPPPSKDALDWARVVVENLLMLVKMVGTDALVIRTGVLSQEGLVDEPHSPFINVVCNVGPSCMTLNLEAGEDFYGLSTVLDFDPGNEEGPHKGALFFDCSFSRQPSNSPGDILRRIISGLSEDSASCDG